MTAADATLSDLAFMNLLWRRGMSTHARPARQIAHDTGYAERTIRRALHTLYAQRHITVVGSTETGAPVYWISPHGALEAIKRRLA